MLLPNKTISYSDSVLAHFPAVLDFLKEKDWNVLELYKKLKKKNHNYNIQNYIETLDCLFALGKSKLPPAEPVALIRHKWPATSSGKPRRNATRCNL